MCELTKSWGRESTVTMCPSIGSETPSDSLCLEEWKPMKRTCELSLTEDSPSTCTPYHLLYTGTD